MVSPLPLLPLLPYGRQTIEDDDVEAVVRALRGDWLTQGPTVLAFEEKLAEATGARYAVAVSNGTAALHLACLAGGVRPGTTGLTTTITFVASANAIRYAGGTPALCDVDPETSLLDVASLERRVSELVAQGRPPKVLVPVDMTGAMADLAAVRALADRIGAVVIEDASHSIGAIRDGERAASGKSAHMATLSFHPVKHLTTGEGGAITTNDESLYRELCELRTHGITRDAAKLRKNDGPWYYEQHALGYNYRITDVQCALGLSQLQKLPRFLARRRELAALYDRAFVELAPRIRPLTVPAGCTSAYHLYVVRLVAHDGEARESVAARRKALYTHLRERQILPQVHYIPVHAQPDFIDSGFAGGDFPGADAYYASCLSLPLFPGMADADVTRVVSAVAEAVR
jgi:UDP-4-amino-4,6-dideoxy-N-acetyl-beta-L-altrosamine transaminase